VLSFNTSIFGRLITDWSVEYMNPNMTSNRMLLDLVYLQCKKKLKRYNKQLIVIRLYYRYDRGWCYSGI